jgi:ASC-1-like (ASCH) protein
MRRGYKKPEQKVTSFKQLAFDWRPSSPRSTHHGATVETDDSITGQRCCGEKLKQDRLFVALSEEPFEWFRSGHKKWELRKLGRQFTTKHVRIGRRVELRKGYRGPASLWGEIVRVIEAPSIDQFFEQVPFEEVIPAARSRENAVEIASAILNVSPHTPVLGFSISRL